MALPLNDRPAPALALVGGDGTSTPLPHEIYDEEGRRVAFAMAADWSRTLVARLAVRDQGTLDDLDIPAHEHAVAERASALLAVLPVADMPRLTRLLQAFADREQSTACTVALCSWEVGYAAAIRACTGVAPDWEGLGPSGERPV